MSCCLPAAASRPALTQGADAEASRLTAAVAHGDESAFQQLYDRYHDRLLRLLLVLSRGDESLSHELVQSVMLTAAAKLRPLGSESHLWNWLARVARQHLSKAWRRQRRESTVVAMAAVPDCPNPDQPDRILELGIDDALSQLDPGDRQVVEWFYFEHRSHKEISAYLGSSPKAVASRLERLRARLKSFLLRRLNHES